jgi:triphosphatase
MRTLGPVKKLVRAQTAARLKKLDAELRSVARKRVARKIVAQSKRRDADAIHDLRVSIRRLEQDLRVFRDWFEPDQVKRIRGRLRKLMERCAAVRNCDIAIEVLRAAGLRSPGLFAGLEQERWRTREELARTLQSWRRRDRVRHWRGQLQVVQPAGAEFRGTAEEHARRLLPAMLEDLFRAGGEAVRPDSSQRQMHQFRLKSKRTRYTLELFAPVYGPKTKEIMEPLKGLQEKLGAINDCATTLEMIRRDRTAAAAVRRLAGEREAQFRSYWKTHMGSPRERSRWKAVLGAADGKK